MSTVIALGMSDGGLPRYCALCQCWVQVEPSEPAGDAPCPSCGCLLWSTEEPARRVAARLKPGRTRSVAVLRRVLRAFLWHCAVLCALLRVSWSHRISSGVALGRFIAPARDHEPPRTSGVWDPWLDA